jgi:sugar phosphate isomerase/epimerase
MRRLGLAPFGLRDDRVPETGYSRPLETIQAAAAAGLDAVGIFVVSGTGAAPMPITTDAALRHEAQSLLDAEGVEVVYVECLYLEPETDLARVDPALAAGAGLGARELLCIARDPDVGRLVERLSELAERCDPHRLRVNLEFFPNSDVKSLREAVAIVERTGRPDLGIVVDTLHLSRSNGTAADLRRVDPRRLHFAHLCDGVMPAPPVEALAADARDRRYPGEGGLPLSEYLAALPESVPLLLECPIVAESATALDERARRAAAAGRRLLGEA